MIAVGVFVVAAVTSAIVAVLLAVLTYLFLHLGRTTKRTLEGLVASRWLTWLGAAIAVAGVVIGLWLQVSVPNFPPGNGFEAQQRLEYASLGIGMIGSGALLAVGAQIMGMMQAKRESQPPSVAGVTVAELSEP